MKKENSIIKPSSSNTGTDMKKCKGFKNDQDDEWN